MSRSEHGLPIPTQIFWVLPFKPWNIERCQVVDFLGCEHRFYKGGATGHDDDLSIIRQEFTGDFVFKVLEVIATEMPNGEWEAEVLQWEGSSHSSHLI
jgi:hypothetical protein